MTDLLEERLRAAADQAMAGVELTSPEADAPLRPRRNRWWVTAGSALAAAAVLGVVVWAAVLRDPGSTEPVQPSPEVSLQERARAAVSATLAAPEWRSEVSGGVAPFESRFRAPDRFESVSGSGDLLLREVQVGDDLYFTDDDGWSKTETDVSSPASAQLGLLEALLADGPCFAEDDKLVVAWQDPETGCGSSTTALPGDLSPGSDIWVLRIDDDGRVAELAFGEVPGEVGSPRQELKTSSPPLRDEIEVPIWNAGAQRGVILRWAYDNVAPITAPGRFRTYETPPLIPDADGTRSDECTIQVFIRPGSTDNEMQQLNERHDQLRSDQQRPAAEIADELGGFAFVDSVAAPTNDCASGDTTLIVNSAE